MLYVLECYLQLVVASVLRCEEKEVPYASVHLTLKL